MSKSNASEIHVAIYECRRNFIGALGPDVCRAPAFVRSIVPLQQIGIGRCVCTEPCQFTRSSTVITNHS